MGSAYFQQPQCVRLRRQSVQLFPGSSLFGDVMKWPLTCITPLRTIPATASRLPTVSPASLKSTAPLRTSTSSTSTREYSSTSTVGVLLTRSHSLGLACRTWFMSTTSRSSQKPPTTMASAMSLPFGSHLTEHKTQGPLTGKMIPTLFLSRFFVFVLGPVVFLYRHSLAGRTPSLWCINCLFRSQYGSI